jgi:hypothetical protein
MTDVGGAAGDVAEQLIEALGRAATRVYVPGAEVVA